MSSRAHRVLRFAVAASFTAQILVAARPLRFGGGFEVPSSHASTQPEGGPTPAPEGSAPAESVQGDAASGFDYGVSTNSGAFSAVIPLATPPGRLGVEPRLALAYSSASSTPGMIGAGWELVLPSVRMDPNVPLMAAARYQLDGHKLVETSPNTFATEQDTYARIRKTCAGSDCAFTVDTTGGLRLRFGANADAELGGRWGLDRVEDAHGNYMTVAYYTDAELNGAMGTPYGRDGALLPREIRYTGSTTSAPWYTVRFDYELRPTNDAYHFQADWWPANLRYRLKGVRVLGGDGTTIRSYTLAYALSGSGRSVLTSVGVTGVGGATGPQPYTMSYAPSAQGFGAATTLEAPSLDSRVVMGDFNGDGRSDLLTYRRSESGLTLHRWRVQLGTATGLGPAAIWLTGHPYNYPETSAGPAACGGAADRVFVGDWDGDGDADLFHYAAGCGVAPRWRVLVSHAGTFQPVDWIPAAQTGWGSTYDVSATPTATTVFADFTGDGRADALLYRGAQSTLVESRAGAPAFVASSVNPGVTGPLVAAGDWNGDRMTDLVAYVASPSSLSPTCSQGGGAFGPCGGLMSVSPTSRVLTGDFTGDGLTDLLVDGATMWTSTRLGFRSKPVTPMTVADVGDVDGDGRDDLLGYVGSTATSWTLRTWLSRGSVFVPGSSAGFPDVALGSMPSCPAYVYSPALLVGDVTGDGRVDPILRARDPSNGVCAGGSGQFITLAADAPAVDRLDTLRTPTGLGLQLDYQRSSSPGLPISLPVVKELRVRDYPRMVGTRLLSPLLETHRYSFSGGGWDAARGELLGFASGRDDIVERNLSEVTSYHQDLARRGKPISIAHARTTPYEVLSSDHFSYRDDASAPYRTEVDWRTRLYWAGGLITARSLEGFEYDGSGNTARVNDHGLCSTTSDDRTTITSYRAGTDFTVQRPAQIDLYRGTAAPPASVAGLAAGCAGTGTLGLVESTRHEYDGAPAAIVRGDLTRTWKLDLGGGGQTWRRVRDFAYRGDGLLQSTTDGRGLVASVVSYDPVLDLYPARVRDGAGHEVLREYSPYHGKLTRETDANGAVTTRSYDGFGRATALRRPSASALWLNTTSWTYGDTFPTWVATVTPYQSETGSPGGRAAVTFRDALGRPIATVEDGDTTAERVVRDRRTYVAATSVPSAIYPPIEVPVSACTGVMTCLASWASWQPAQISLVALTTAPGTPARFESDPLGRVVTRINPDGSRVSYTHAVDAQGFGITELDEAGHLRRLYRDAHGDLARVERWDGVSATPVVTTYAHDVRGKLTSIVSPEGVVTSLAWGSLGRLDRVDSPELGTTTYGYDADGHEIQRVDARGVVVTTAVDALGRPSYRTTSTGDVTLWAYDRDPLCFWSCTPAPPASDNTMGRPWAVLDASGMTTFGYDADGNLARETRTVDGTPYATTYQTFTTGQVVQKTFPDGRVHRYALAPDGRQRALFVDGALAVEMTRDAQGRPSQVRFGTGASTEYLVDPLTQRVDAVETVDAGNAVAQYLVYDYAPDGTVAAIYRNDDAVGQREELHLTHDGLGRITDVHVAPELVEPAEHYAYDADGRMKERRDRGGDAEKLAYDDPAHPHAVTAIGARELEYDAAGNRVAERAADGTPRSYSYDGLGRLVDVDGGRHRYQYDADGHRVIEDGPAGRRVVLGDHTIEPDRSTRTALLLDGVRFGERSSLTGNRYFHVDHTQSVIGESDASGRLDTVRTFSAYGVTVGERRAAAASRFGFAGYVQDDTGLYFAQARYYDPSTAGFTQPDSWLYGFDDPEVLSAYAYAANSPYDHVDPSGHFVVAAAAVAAGVSFVVGMIYDIAAAEGHPDWGNIIVKNLLSAAVNGTISGYLPGLFDPAVPPYWRALGFVLRGAVNAGVTVGFNAAENGIDQVAFQQVVDTGGGVGLISLLIFGGLGGSAGALVVTTTLDTLAAHVLDSLATSDARSSAIHLEAPSPASAVPPPACGRADVSQTLPRACEVSP